MMDTFAEAFDHTVGIEGDFSHDKRDSGGATRFGVTEAVARKHGYAGDMRAMPFDLAIKIARVDYWDKVMGDRVAELSPKIATELFDTAYNMGHDRATWFLQRALNCFNRSDRPVPPGPDYPNLKHDGQMGEKTLEALRTFLKRRGKPGEGVMLVCLNSQQCDGYLDIATARPKDEAFVYGQILQRVML